MVTSRLGKPLRVKREMRVHLYFEQMLLFRAKLCSHATPIYAPGDTQHLINIREDVTSQFGQPINPEVHSPDVKTLPSSQSS